jgi:hypothetical protein
MKAQDKIYIDDLAVVNDCTTKNSTKPLPNFSEYIRKDALLEWAKEEMREWSSESNTSQGVKMGLTLVIDKIESM